MLVLVMVGIALAAVAFVTRDYGVARTVELQIAAAPGDTTLELSSDELRPMSPGCGCLEPARSADDWRGMSLPSTDFELRVVSEPAAGLDGKRWALTAMSPELAPYDWFGPQEYSVHMSVLAGKPGARRLLFSGRASFARIISTDRVHVGYGKRFPYAALMPAAGGPVTFSSGYSSRSDFGSTMSVRAIGPRRSDVSGQIEKGISPSEYAGRKDLTQRGPMVDVLGPDVWLSIPHSRDLNLYAGELPISGFRAGEPVTVKLRTPFSVRLTAHPATRAWIDILSVLWRNMSRAAAGGDRIAKGMVRPGRMLQEPFGDFTAQPKYSLLLENVRVPPVATWRRFAREAARQKPIPAMLGSIPQDGVPATKYKLPPVGPEMGVGVFGPLATFESNAVSGRVLTEGREAPFGRGQLVSVSSDDGLASGRYQNALVVAAGVAAGSASLSGGAMVSIDDHPVNRLPYLPILWGVVGLAFIGLLVEAFVKWGVRPH